MTPTAINTATPLPENYLSKPSSPVVLFLGNQNAQHDDITHALTTIKEQYIEANSNSSLSFEQLDRIPSITLKQKRFSDIISGFVSATVHHSKPTLIKFVNALQPGGRLLFRELVSIENTTCPLHTLKSIESQLKLIGFIDIRVTADAVTNIENAKLMLMQVNATGIENPMTETQIAEIAPYISIVQVSARKPAYENGAIAVLPQSLKRKPKSVSTTSTESQASAWSKIVAMSDVNDTLINDDELLDEEDRQKPNPELLSQPSACETRVKSCKNCSCGRAELEAMQMKNVSLGVVQGRDADDDLNVHPVTNFVPPTVKSSCGNCYLGDAFRCSSCPYVGLPAFQPGEVVQLPVSMMQDDI